jgi:DNA-binding phage protein
MPYHTTDYLKNQDDMAEYLNAAIEDGDEQILLMAISEIMAVIPKNNFSKDFTEKGLPTEGKELRFSHLRFILHALGLEISVRPR